MHVVVTRLIGQVVAKIFHINRFCMAMNLIQGIVICFVMIVVVRLVNNITKIVTWNNVQFAKDKGLVVVVKSFQFVTRND
jgi:hypothetical protein